MDMTHDYEEAFRQVLAHRTMIMAAIRSVIRDPHQAEDVFSEATLEIVRKWERYDSDRPFAPWARGVARNMSLAAIRKAVRQPTPMDDDVLEMLGTEFDEPDNGGWLEEYKPRLVECVGKLSDNAQRLVKSRYFEHKSYTQISEEEGKTTGALYVAFTRIHQSLHRCLKRRTNPV